MVFLQNLIFCLFWDQLLRMLVASNQNFDQVSLLNYFCMILQKNNHLFSLLVKYITAYSLLRVNTVDSPNAPGPFPPTFTIGRSFYIDNFFLCCPVCSQVAVVILIIDPVVEVVIIRVEVIIFIFNFSVVVSIRSANRNNLLELGPQVFHKFSWRCPCHCHSQDLVVTRL